MECQKKKKKKGPSFLPCCFFYRAAKTHNLLAQTVPQGSFRGFFFFVEFSNFEPLFGLKSAMPVRIDLEDRLQISPTLLRCFMRAGCN